MNNFLVKYQNMMGKINYAIFLATVVLLPLPQVFARYAWIAWLITWILEMRFLKKENINPWKKMLPFLLFGAWYIWKLISGLWSKDLEAYHWFVERYMTFGLLIPVGIWGVNSQYNWKQICRALVIGCIISAFFYPITLYWINHANIPLEEFGELPRQEFSLTFFTETISYIKHRLFLCSIMMTGIMAILYIRQDICDKYGRKLGWTMICLGIFIMSLLILATGSRASILSGAGLITIALLYKLPIRKIRYQIAFIVFAAAIGCFALAQHPRMNEENLKQELRTNVISKEKNPRLNIWRIALENRSEYSAYGIGAGQSFGYLQLKYREHQIYHYRQLNAHNQYLEEWIEIGIPGMIFFILAWMSILYCATDKGRKTATLLVTLYGLNMLTDCMFGRFDGIALWATFMILILLQSDTQCHQQASGDAQ